MSVKASAARGLLPVALALVVGAVAADAIRRTLWPLGRAATPESRPTTVTVAAASGRVDDNPQPLAAGRPDSNALASRRAETRRRLLAEAAGTYLLDILPGTDSMIRRWPDERTSRPLRLAVTRAGVAGFREEFVANVAWAVSRWNGAMLPVRLEAGADSGSADILLTWVARLDSNRTGRADLTWDRHGHIRRADVILATHTPDGRPLDAPEMTALALHELGHALGLGHSPQQEDALYPVTRAIELTERDRRTARLLYSLPTGSLR